MFLKWIRILLIIFILFSYIPVMPVQACAEGNHEENHKENGKLDCGYIFHCPFVSSISTHQFGKNPRAAVEAAVRSVKHPFPAGQLPVRGLFRATCMLVASAAMSNIRSIWRFKHQKPDQSQQQAESTAFSFLAIGTFFQRFSVPLSCFSC